jgi:hypothetical protein
MIAQQHIDGSQAGRITSSRAGLHTLEIGDTMETNPYEYDRTVPWIPQQNQFYEGRYVTERTSQQQPSALQNQRLQQRGGDQKPKPPERMPKAQTLALEGSVRMVEQERYPSDTER